MIEIWIEGVEGENEEVISSFLKTDNHETPKSDGERINSQEFILRFMNAKEYENFYNSLKQSINMSEKGIIRISFSEDSLKLVKEKLPDNVGVSDEVQKFTIKF